MSETLGDKYARLIEFSALQTIALDDVRLERDCLKEDLAKAIEFADRLRGDIKQLRVDLEAENVSLRSLLKKTLPILDETARNLTGDPEAYSGLANLIRASLKG